MRRPEWAVALATYFEPERAVHVRECMCIILLVGVILTFKKKTVDTVDLCGTDKTQHFHTIQCLILLGCDVSE